MLHRYAHNSSLIFYEITLITHTLVYYIHVSIGKHSKWFSEFFYVTFGGKNVNQSSYNFRLHRNHIKQFIRNAPANHSLSTSTNQSFKMVL